MRLRERVKRLDAVAASVTRKRDAEAERTARLDHAARADERSRQLRDELGAIIEPHMAPGENAKAMLHRLSAAELERCEGILVELYERAGIS